MKKEEKTQSAQDKGGLGQSARLHDIIDTAENACPRCHYANEAAVAFCEECGASLHQPAPCPHCGVPTRPRADICEVCGGWLLKGQCMFCYCIVEQGETYCGECGNPAAGIMCPQCGKLSHFDFCDECNIPLSLQAKEMVESAANDPDCQEIAALLVRVATVDTDQAPHDVTQPDAPPEREQTVITRAEEISRMKAYRESLHENKESRTSQTNFQIQAQPKSLFTNQQRDRIKQLNAEVAQEEERRRIEEERRRREEEERRRQEEERRRQEEERRKLESERRRIKEEKRRVEAAERQRQEGERLRREIDDVMRKFSGKKFSSNQEARRFYMSIISGLSEEAVRRIGNLGLGWRCNAYDCVHDSPNDCADPSRGGVWLIR